MLRSTNRASYHFLLNYGGRNLYVQESFQLLRYYRPHFRFTYLTNDIYHRYSFIINDDYTYCEIEGGGGYCHGFHTRNPIYVAREWAAHFARRPLHVRNMKKFINKYKCSVLK